MSDLFESVCKTKSWEIREDGGVRLQLPDGRGQTVFSEVVEVDDEQVLRVWTVIGEAMILDRNRLTGALGLNWRLVYGAMAIKDEYLVMVDTFLLREADEDELIHSIEYMAAEADRYERLLYRAEEH